MKGKKCYIVYLTLFVLVVPLFLTSLDVSALKHTFTGLFYKSQEVPLPNNRNGQLYFDWTTTDFSDVTTSGGGFSIKFEGDAYDDYVNNYKLTHKVSNFSATYDYTNNYCYVSSLAYGNNMKSMFEWDSDGSTYRDFLATSNNFPQISKKWTSVISNNTSMRCRRPFAYGSNSTPTFHNESLNNIPMTCDFNEYGCVGLNGTIYEQNYYRDYMDPYWTTSNGFWLMSKAVDTTSGLHYSHTFSFKDMFSIPVRKFSYLSLPFNSTNDYFYNPDNLYRGRHIDFNMVMEFDGDFNWHENIESNGSSIKIKGEYLPLSYSGGSLSWHTFNRDCTANLRDVPAIPVKQLELSCPMDLPDDMLMLNLQLVIDGNGNYVFETNDDWRIGQMYIITDYDDTPGEDFNDDLFGNEIMGDAEDDVPSESDVDWFTSLTRLFNFGLINPFAPLFEMFSDNSTCVNVPTLAGMIHLENDEVCPWFSSSTRSITTPVLSISAMMLLFGFVVRWLGSSSGNFMEDGRHEEVTNKWSGGWGHWKK